MKNDDVLKYLISCVQVLLLAMASWATSEIRDATKSINALNVTMASLLSEVSNQKKDIQRLDFRVTELEHKK
jgi:hypothetical protein